MPSARGEGPNLLVDMAAVVTVLRLLGECEVEK